MSLKAEPIVPAEVLAAIRAPFEAFGGTWAEAGVLQPLSVLLDLAGEAMRARLLVVQAEGVEDAVLRPDFTIPVARAHIASGAASGRYLYQGSVFTAPQGPGQPAEALQVGAEMFGPPTDEPADDGAVIALGWSASAAGGRADLALTLGDIGLFADFLAVIGAPAAASARLVRALADGHNLANELERAKGAPAPVAAGSGRLAGLLGDLPEEEAARVLEELWRLAGIQPVGGRSAAEIVHRLVMRSESARAPRLSPAEIELIGRYLAVSGPPRQALDQVERLALEARAPFDLQLHPWVRRLSALVEAGVPESAITLSTGFARPFGYYDGVLFEVTSAALGPALPLAAGGRYDGLLARLGRADQAGAVGCMVRPGRIWAGAAA